MKIFRCFIASTVLITSFAASNAFASDWGCTVLLCLANPAGPTAAHGCSSPIHKLWKHLAEGHSFPSCEMQSAPEAANTGNTFAKQGYSYFDPCPQGTTALANGDFAIQGLNSVNQTSRGLTISETAKVLTGIGTGESQHFFGLRGQDGDIPNKICVGNKIADATKRVPAADRDYGYDILDVGVYDKVVVMDPADSPRIIDVYIDNNLYRRVHW